MAKAKSENTGKKGGMPPHKPTEITLKRARLLAGYRVPKEQIALIIGVNTDTLEKYYGDEMRKGVANTNRRVVKALLKNALDGDTTAQIWWTKAQLGWSEKKDDKEKDETINRLLEIVTKITGQA
jgi:hypothetical protein